jgi:ribonuclease BN (tRNA processing enzyme)
MRIANEFDISDSLTQLVERSAGSHQKRCAARGCNDALRRRQSSPRSRESMHRAWRRTGTPGGPPAFTGLAGPGALVRYGDDGNDCGAVKLQFDRGSGTTMRLSQLGVFPAQLNAVFFTHIRSDHTEGYGPRAATLVLQWHGPKIDAVCSSDVFTRDVGERGQHHRAFDHSTHYRARTEQRYVSVCHHRQTNASRLQPPNRSATKVADCAMASRFRRGAIADS